MNKFRQGLVIGLGSISIGLSQGAVATPITAAATLDWSQLQLVFTSLNGSESAATFSNYRTSLSSQGDSGRMNESNSKSVNDWGSTIETNADAGGVHASTLASSLSFSGSAMATNGSASSSGTRSLDFFADGPGVLTVIVPYTLSLIGDSDCYYCYYDHATVSGNASFNNYTGNGSSSAQSNVSYSLTDDYWNPSPDSQAGSLVFGIVTSRAGYGSLSVGFDLSAQASVVPEPQTYAMLLAGLMLIGRIARRRSISFT
ncbi:putative secreted protein with PEP-CTERM sorting signal [Nitrosospira sp. Nsp5]|uniref:PEP-CTERM protein-sorting domain-containing protein n=1 Tax=Nitrosospira multiformis TaxID=1231 RepID=A0ABY0TGM5_9PROT|nr:MULTISPECIES: PEP-CTERM sorting domain-containing protein [Nitrosospira]PTR10586.1 putative secreted protein with PEP-CTERM sorting signal [Nitrosospira sp. Nsp5]SDQ80271.1 PEP-CTERM protein-sorting domain-containing protein [Nitrosospira multiformis]